MEAPDHRDRVRPLPPEGEPGEDHRAPSMRALLPMLAGGLVLVVFIAILSIGGGTNPPQNDAGGAADTTTPTFVRPVSSTTTTTIAVPTTIFTREAPEFREVLPDFAGGLNVVVEREDGTLAVARWRVDRRFPQFTDLPSGPGYSAIDASGTLVATIGDLSARENAGLLSIGPAVLGVSPKFVQATTFVWHSATPGLMAVVGRQPTDELPGLFILQLDPTGNVTSTSRIRDVGPTWFVAAFHQDRIVLVDTDIGQPVLRIVDTTGAELATAVGFSTATSDDLIFGAGETDLGFAARAWTWDLDTPTELPRYAANGLPDLVSPNGRHGGSVLEALDGSAATVVVRSDDLAGPRANGIDGRPNAVFFFTDDHVAVFSSEAGELLIIEWRTGITVTLQLEGVTVRDISAPGYGIEPVVPVEGSDDEDVEDVADA